MPPPSEAIQQHVLVITKYPEAGRAKTRLIPRLGAEGAAAMSRRLTERCAGAARRYAAAPAGDEAKAQAQAAVWVHYAGGDEARMRGWLGGDLAYAAQAGGDLGARLTHALASSFSGGAARAVAVGTDIPEISENTLGAAFAALRAHDVVVGPAADGGYYLIGVRAGAWPRASALFHGVAWSTDAVLAQTRARAAAAGLSVALLGVLCDVDVADDVEYAERVLSSGV